MDGLIEGLNCHYVAFNGRHLAALIIGVTDKVRGVVDLVVFTNMANVNGDKNFGVQFHQNVPHQANPGMAGTWHFIEQA